MFGLGGTLTKDRPRSSHQRPFVGLVRALPQGLPRRPARHRNPREMRVFCRILVMRQHVPSLALADGLSLEECDALADWRACKFFSASERAVLAYTDTMTRDITVPDAVFAEVERHFNAREIVELTVLIGTYNMNARVLQALQLDLEPAAP